MVASTLIWDRPTNVLWCRLSVYRISSNRSPRPLNLLVQLRQNPGLYSIAWLVLVPTSTLRLTDGNIMCTAQRHNKHVC